MEAVLHKENTYSEWLKWTNAVRDNQIKQTILLLSETPVCSQFLYLTFKADNMSKWCLQLVVLPPSGKKCYQKEISYGYYQSPK